MTPETWTVEWRAWVDSCKNPYSKWKLECKVNWETTLHLWLQVIDLS